MPFGVRCGPSPRDGRVWTGCWCGRCRWLCPAGRAVGAGVVRMRFWAPGSPPQAFAWRDSMPVVPAGRPCAGLVGVAVRGGLRTG